MQYRHKAMVQSESELHDDALAHVSYEKQNRQLITIVEPAVQSWDKTVSPNVRYISELNIPGY